MLIILNKLTLQKELQNIFTNNVFQTKRKKTQQQQMKKTSNQTPAEAGNLIRDRLHPKRMHCHSTTESTESIDCSQAFKMFRRNRSKRK